MMREQDHNRKSELLLQAIGELPDEMIAQAAPRQRKRGMQLCQKNERFCINGSWSI